jgi:hypothetical protein
MFHGGGVHVNVAAPLMLLLKDLETKEAPAQIKLADS